MNAHEIISDLERPVAEVCVAEGDEVSVGDPLVVLGCRSRVPILAELDGVVRRLCVPVGAIVGVGETVAVIEAMPAPVLARRSP